MKSVSFATFGGPEVIEVIEEADPVAGPGQVLVAVEAASINPVDVTVLSGAVAQKMPEGATPPYVVGWDLAGHVTAVGDGVDPALVGSYVVGFVPWFKKGRGSQSSLVVLDQDQFAEAPDTISPEELTTLGLNALTAFHVVAAVDPQPGEIILVTGATGAVGGYVVEFASKRGATVWAMAKDEDAELVTGFGAARQVPRSAADAVAEVPAGADVVIDTASLGTGILGAVRDGGRYFTVSTPIDGERGIEVKRVGVHADAADLATIVGLAAEGELALRVERTFPVEEARDAYDFFVSGSHRGRVVLLF